MAKLGGKSSAPMRIFLDRSVDWAVCRHQIPGHQLYALLDISHAIPSGKLSHNYRKSTHFQWENPLLLW